MGTTVKIFSHHTNIKTFQAGQTIFTEGDAGITMFGVVEGEVEIFINGNVVERAGAGSIIGEMALIDHQARSGSAIAKTDCKLAEVDEKQFQFLVQQTPNFALQVMRILVERLRRMDQAGVDYLN